VEKVFQAQVFYIIALAGSIEILCTKAMAQSYALKHAFCTDYARAHSNINSSSFYYDLQVAYSRCMSNASQRIKDYESLKRRNEYESQIRNETYQREQRERARLEEIERKRIEYEEQVRREQENENKRQAEMRELQLMERINSESTFQINPYK
jgi:hypothetical protein